MYTCMYVVVFYSNFEGLFLDTRRMLMLHVALTYLFGNQTRALSKNQIYWFCGPVLSMVVLPPRVPNRTDRLGG